MFTPLFSPAAHQNGAAQFSRAPAHQPSEVMYSAPHRPPSTILPKLNSQQRAPRAPVQNQYNQTNMDFLNVPDQGMSG